MSDFVTTKNAQNYFNVKLIRDARFFEKKEPAAGKEYGQPACTYVTFFHNTKGGEDLVIDARILRNAAYYAQLKKGATVCLTGTLGFKKDDRGQIQGVMYDAVLSTTEKLEPTTGTFE